MSKKKFIDGLESLFGDEATYKNEENLVIGERGEEETYQSRKRSASSKNFTSDLDSLFEDALKESIQEQAKKLRRKSLDTGSVLKRRTRKPVTGLDALIRNTVETTEVNIKNDPPVKRITFAFKRDKIEKLKTIARLERAYIKDIVDDVISEFIDDYEQQKGHLSEE